MCDERLANCFPIKVRQTIEPSRVPNEESNEKAVHPAGFRPFGKVSIASQISVAIRTTATDVPDYTGDDTFTPELASTLVNIFQVELERRMEAPTYNLGDTDDQILLENGLVPGDKIILDAKSTTSTTTSNVDFSILLEDSLQPTGYGYDTAYIILDSSDTGFVDEHGNHKYFKAKVLPNGELELIKEIDPNKQKKDGISAYFIECDSDEEEKEEETK